MQFQHVRYFLTLAQTLNFTRAAEQCNVTQPALTKALQKLEYEFGGDLIHREGRLTQLTDLGKLVLPMLQRTVDAADTARKQAKQYRSEQIAPLYVGLPPSISASLMVEPLSTLICCVDGLQVHLVEDDGKKLIDALLEGRIHAALLSKADDLPQRVDHWRLFEENYVVVVAPGHPFARFEALPITALGQTVWLKREECEAYSHFEQICFCANGGFQATHRGRHEDHLQHMAAAGLGALLVPEHMPHLPNVVSRRIEGDPVSRNVELAVVAGRRYSPALDAFVKVMRRHDWQSVVKSGVVASAAAEAHGLECTDNVGPANEVDCRNEPLASTKSAANGANRASSAGPMSRRPSKEAARFVMGVDRSPFQAH